MTPSARPNAPATRARLDDALVRYVARLSREGYPPVIIAAFAGVDPSTVRRWRAAGRADRAAGRRTLAARFDRAMARASGEADAGRREPTWDVRRLTPEERDTFTRLLVKAMTPPREAEKPTKG